MWGTTSTGFLTQQGKEQATPVRQHDVGCQHQEVIVAKLTEKSLDTVGTRC